MVILNEQLLRKRSEHNDGLLADLEEIALHQFEIEKIESLSSSCKHIRILLLQNNIISRIENIHKLKELEYLNLALNNITRIENTASCESLRKLDLTVNFIDFDEFETSIRNLQANYNLEDLYLVGNPIATNWDASKYREYVIARLPSLKQLDGRLVSPSERIAACSVFGQLENELVTLAVRVAESKRLGTYDSSSDGAYTRQSRLEMYRELGEQKAEKENAEKQRLGVSDPKPPRTLPSVLNTRGEIRQCNEGGYEYKLDEWSVPGQIIFEIAAPRFMDSSLIDIDLNPRYVRCAIKGKLTQVKFDSEVVVGISKIERSRTSGVIKCVCPIDGWTRRPSTLASSNCPIATTDPPPDLPPPLEAI